MRVDLTFAPDDSRQVHGSTRQPHDGRQRRRLGRRILHLDQQRSGPRHGRLCRGARRRPAERRWSRQRCQDSAGGATGDGTSAGGAAREWRCQQERQGDRARLRCVSWEFLDSRACTFADNAMRLQTLPAQHKAPSPSRRTASRRASSTLTAPASLTRPGALLQDLRLYSLPVC